MDDDIARQIQRSVRAWRAETGLTYAEAAQTLGVSVGLLHGFLNGDTPQLGSLLWRALYRERAELRWLLEEFQRRSALAASTRPDAPATMATGPPRRPRTASSSRSAG